MIYLFLKGKPIQVMNYEKGKRKNKKHSY